MKMYAYKDLEDSNKIKTIQCLGDAEAIMKKAHPDKIVSGEGTEESPYVYAATAELMGELEKDEDGKYIKPDKYFRDAWQDNSGSVEVDLAAARALKKAEIEAKCKELCAPYKEAYAEADIDGDQSAKDAAKASFDAIKAQATAGKAAVDSESDLDAMKAYDSFA